MHYILDILDLEASNINEGYKEKFTSLSFILSISTKYKFIKFITRETIILLHFGIIKLQTIIFLIYCLFNC